jgi:PAS domain S-box-containing protein
LVKHSLLLRQLKKLALTVDHAPSLDTWKIFISHVESAYQDADQDRYLLERSMEISSRELRELYDNLQQAQETAKLGTWSYDVETDSYDWSKELTALTGFDPNQVQITFKDFLEIIHPEQRKKYFLMFEETIRKGKEYEIEVALTNPKGESYWLYMIGKPQVISLPNYKVKNISGIVMDITRRKKTEAQMSELNQQLIETARLAGMAEVATSVLHNVGNLLNSVNVSVQVLINSYKSLNLKKLKQLIELIVSHQDSLEDFFKHDPKGKLIPTYLIEVSKVTEKENEMLSSELFNITERIQDIRDIIAMQQIFSGHSIIKEKVNIAELIKEASKISGVFFPKSLINFESYGDIKQTIYVEKSKLLLILINLIRNAKDAVIASNSADKNISIKTTLDDDLVTIIVEDNGIGIKPEDAPKIFDYGFSTKKNGHGFGLNSSASAAKQLGGSLEGKSHGAGKGAKFVLTFTVS